MITPINIFKNSMASSPLSIQAESRSGTVKATLSEDGTVDINNKKFKDIEDAMQSVPREPASTSNAWQFWSFYSSERDAWTPLEHLRAQLETQRKPKEVKTSQTHPLRIDAIELPNTAGKLGLTFCPGKVCDGLYGGTWDRDLTTDIEAIRSWGASTLISLMEIHEFELLGVPQFPERIRSSQLKWHHLPIKDMQIPDNTFEKNWNEISKALYEDLRNGESLVIHCRGGLGRTGLLAARILTECGINPIESVRRVREARPNSIETYTQEHYVLTKAWHE